MTKAIAAAMLALLIMLAGGCESRKSADVFRLTDISAQEYAVLCLREVDGVEKILCVINEGGEPYSAAVFFESPLIEPAQAYGDTEHEKEINRGGCIEVFSTVAKATARKESIQGDNHTQLGNFIIRLSALLGTQEKDKLKADIAAAILAEAKMPIVASAPTAAVPTHILEPTSVPSVAPTEDKAEENRVWVTESGSRYHSKSDCSGMENAVEMEIRQAAQKGYTPCKRCYKQ